MEPIKTPIVMTVETTDPSLIQPHNNCDKESRKKMPHIKARRDKNKSQRIGIFV
jgi:hypothetical protein